ncbi:hypothetical protein SVIOM74S_01117 [Streptomyces violarus]
MASRAFSAASLASLAASAARSRAASSAFFLAAASSAACFWAAAWASICSATVSPMVTTGVRPVCSTAGSAAKAGAATVPMTPVVARARHAFGAGGAALHTAGTTKRSLVARVNAMERPVLSSFLLAYRVS